MSQTHRDRVKEAKRKRREYLLSSARIVTMGSVGLCAMMGCGLLGIFGLVATVWSFMVLHTTRLFLFSLILTIFAFFMTYLGHRTIKLANKKTAETPYVPPVAEQLANLPAEEVLLRGSDQPAATPEELLRAAQAGKETEAQELLRAEQVRSDEQQHTDAVQVQQTRP